MSGHLHDARTWSTVNITRFTPPDRRPAGTHSLRLRSASCSRHVCLSVVWTKLLPLAMFDLVMELFNVLLSIRSLYRLTVVNDASSSEHVSWRSFTTLLIVLCASSCYSVLLLQTFCSTIFSFGLANELLVHINSYFQLTVVWFDLKKGNSRNSSDSVKFSGLLLLFVLGLRELVTLRVADIVQGQRVTDPHDA